MKLMKFKFFALFFLLISFAVQAEMAIDKPAPDFALTNIKGESVSLADYRGKYVVLEWTNHQCPFVQKHYDSSNMQSLQKKYTDKDVVWLSVISSAPGRQGHVSPEQAAELTEQREAHPTHVLFDPEGDVGKSYNAKTTPHMYIIDPNGTLRYAGAIDSIRSANPADIEKAENYVVSGMSALLAGNEVANKLTPPYGCTIKYGS